MSPEQLKALRLQLGLSQREMAERINAVDPNLRVYPNSYNRWERGHVTPGPHARAAMRRIANETDSPMTQKRNDDGPVQR